MDERTKRRLATSTRFGDIRELAEVDSTNRYLMALARAGAPEGVVVVADHQSAGRGRQGRTWDAPAGTALLVSILLRPTVRPDRRWLVTAGAALAAADACNAVRDASGPDAAIKWPNDLLLGDAKLAGMLAEADAGAVVVGIGINVGGAPPGAAALGPGVDRGDLLTALLENLDGWYNRLDQAGDAYRRRCATVGRLVRVEIQGPAGGGRAGVGQTVFGRADEVTADGRLRVVAGGQVHLFAAADVVHVRTENDAVPAAGDATDP